MLILDALNFPSIIYDTGRPFRNSSSGIAFNYFLDLQSSWTQGILISENSHERPLSESNTWPHTTAFSTQCWMLHQTTSKTGTQAHQQTGYPRTLQNAPTRIALPIRGKNLTSTHQNVGTSPFQQEAYPSHWTNFTHRGRDQKQEELCPHSLEKETSNTVS